MRLTNVSQMQTQAGRLSSYVVTVGSGRRDPLPVSFDQKRHVSFGSRPGAWMAVSFQLPRPASLEELGEAWLHVLRRHGTLRSVFSWKEESGDKDHSENAPLELASVELTEGEWQPLTGEASAGEIRATLRELFDVACDPFGYPSHRLCVIEPSVIEPSSTEVPGPTPQIVIGSDHSHVDAWSLLVLVRDLTVCLEDLAAGRTPGAQLPAADSFAAHTQLLAEKPAPPEEVLQRWREILHAGKRTGIDPDSAEVPPENERAGSMPNFPLNLGNISSPVDEVVEIRDVFDAEELAFLEAHAAEHGVRLIAVAVSVMTRLARELAGQPLRTVFPVHSREDPRWFDSVGWFITNSVLENDDDSYAASYRTVKEAIRLGSYPLEPIMQPYGGMPQEPGMFAMSWLDHRKLPVNVPEDLNPQHISAVIRTDGVMIWFVINESGMHLRCRYPDTRQARRAMRTWLAGLVYGLRAPLEHGGFGG